MHSNSAISSPLPSRSKPPQTFPQSQNHTAAAAEQEWIRHSAKSTAIPRGPSRTCSPHARSPASGDLYSYPMEEHTRNYPPTRSTRRLANTPTLPQYRPQDAPLLDTPTTSFGATPDQFPVWYFFYGALASAPKHCSQLSLAEGDIPVLYAASIMWGRMETWGRRRYCALVEGLETSCVQGAAYRVMSEEHEDALRRCETCAYEAVRCLIEMDGMRVEGCTFRFVGETDWGVEMVGRRLLLNVCYWIFVGRMENWKEGKECDIRLDV